MDITPIFLWENIKKGLKQIIEKEREMMTPARFSLKYRAMLRAVSYEIVYGYPCWQELQHRAFCSMTLPPGLFNTYILSLEPLLQLVEKDPKKAQDMFFEPLVHLIFCGETRTVLSQIESVCLWLPSKSRISPLKEKEFFWSIIGDRKKEFLRKCWEYKQAKRSAARQEEKDC